MGQTESSRRRNASPCLDRRCRPAPQHRERQRTVCGAWEMDPSRFESGSSVAATVVRICAGSLYPAFPTPRFAYRHQMREGMKRHRFEQRSRSPRSEARTTVFVFESAPTRPLHHRTSAGPSAPPTQKRRASTLQPTTAEQIDPPRTTPRHPTRQHLHDESVSIPQVMRSQTRSYP